MFPYISKTDAAEWTESKDRNGGPSQPVDIAAELVRSTLLVTCDGGGKGRCSVVKCL